MLKRIQTIILERKLFPEVKQEDPSNIELAGSTNNFTHHMLVTSRARSDSPVGRLPLRSAEVSPHSIRCRKIVSSETAEATSQLPVNISSPSALRHLGYQLLQLYDLQRSLPESMS